MSISQVFITEKIRLLTEYVQKAKDILSAKTDKEILGSDSIYVLERMFQLSVEIAIDINNYLIKELDLKPAEDIQSAFKTLAVEHILPEDLAQKMAPVIGLRNKIVHVYEKIDRESFVRDLRKDIGDFDKYAAAILMHIA
jgi:uncharacterized protein YutE (UPF0331/DUF86 family)